MAATMAARASLAMYPFEQLRAAYQRLWNVVVEHGGPLLPRELSWDDDVAGSWRAPDMVVAQTCGWPLVTVLADVVRVVGAFAHDVEGAEGARYRSAVVANRPGPLADLAGAVVAVNNPDSLSGWVSLRHAFAEHGDVVWTGSHRASLAALVDGRAEVASIDAVSLAHIATAEPRLVAGLQLVGRGPLVPTLPLVARADLADEVVADLRAGLAAATASPALAGARATLRITGFVPLDLADYLPLADLDPELFAEQRSTGRGSAAG